LLTIILEKLVGTQFEAVLHLRKHRSHLLTHGRSQKFIRQIHDILRDACAHEQLRTFICEIVAVVGHDVVVVKAELLLQGAQQFSHEEFLRYFRHSKVNLLSGLS